MVSRRQRSQARQCRRLSQCSRREVGVEPHQLPLRCIERAGCIPDGIRDRDPSQVVQQGSVHHRLHGCRIEPQFTRRGCRDLGDAGGMSARPYRLEVHEVCEGRGNARERRWCHHANRRRLRLEQLGPCLARGEGGREAWPLGACEACERRVELPAGPLAKHRAGRRVAGEAVPLVRRVRDAHDAHGARAGVTAKACGSAVSVPALLLLPQRAHHISGHAELTGEARGDLALRRRVQRVGLRPCHVAGECTKLTPATGRRARTGDGPHHPESIRAVDHAHCGSVPVVVARSDRCLLGGECGAAEEEQQGRPEGRSHVRRRERGRFGESDGCQRSAHGRACGRRVGGVRCERESRQQFGQAQHVRRWCPGRTSDTRPRTGIGRHDTGVRDRWDRGIAPPIPPIRRRAWIGSVGGRPAADIRVGGGTPHALSVIRSMV